MVACVLGSVDMFCELRVCVGCPASDSRMKRCGDTSRMSGFVLFSSLGSWVCIEVCQLGAFRSYAHLVTSRDRSVLSYEEYCECY